MEQNEKTEQPTADQLWSHYGKMQARREILAGELEQVRQNMQRVYQQIAQMENEPGNG